jgi:pentapeptide MXKDX repeat protein
MSVDLMSVDQMSVDQMSVDQMSVDQMSVDQMSVDQMSVNQMSVQMSVDQMSVEQMFFVQKTWSPKLSLIKRDRSANEDTPHFNVYWSIGVVDLINNFTSFYSDAILNLNFGGLEYDRQM